MNKDSIKLSIILFVNNIPIKSYSNYISTKFYEISD